VFLRLEREKDLSFHVARDASQHSSGGTLRAADRDEQQRLRPLAVQPCRERTMGKRCGVCRHGQPDDDEVRRDGRRELLQRFGR
jgi:hypothetical protein